MAACSLLPVTASVYDQDEKIIEVNSNELKQLMGNGVPVIDVRVPYEWHDTGIIDGTIPIVFYDEKGQPQPDSWMLHAASYIKQNKGIALICRTGRRSRAVANYLIEEYGCNRIYNVDTGIKGWLEAGNETLCPLLCPMEKFV